VLAYRNACTATEIFVAESSFPENLNGIGEWIR
jgi:hypothetical protein